MSYSHLQFDGVDIGQREMSEIKIKEEEAVTDKKYFNEAVQESRHSGYVSPYRAAYFRGGN